MTRWLSTADGAVDPMLVKLWTIVFLAVAGGVALIVGVLYQTFRNGQAETSGLLWMAGICVAPLTGAGVGLGFGSAAGKAQARAIQAGSQPGRRASDTAESRVPTGDPGVPPYPKADPPIN